MYPLQQSFCKRAFLLATGQVTSYGSGIGVDDGAAQIGIIKTYTIFTLGQYSGVTNIAVNGKTDAHSNNCVWDNNTGLMWSRTASASVGPSSNGLLPWTTNANNEGIFPYCAAANAAGLAGYSDWRVPNFFELISIADEETPTGVPNSTAFPSYPVTTQTWTSTTRSNNTATALMVEFLSGQAANLAKTSNLFCELVRG